MTRSPFLPTAPQLNVLLTVGFLSLGYALYLRYLVIEQSAVGLACEAGLSTWLCLTRRVVIALFTYYVFGATAVAAAVLHLLRPSLLLLLIGVAAAGLGIVLYNVGLATLAVALLILALARPKSAPA
jgi:hypothetical protein